MKFTCFILMMCIGWPVILFSQVQKDSSDISARHFNTAAIQKLKSEKDFNYLEQQEPVKSIWERFWEWVWYKWQQIISTEAGRTSVKAIAFSLAVLIIVYVVSRLIGIDGSRLFGRKNDSLFSYQQDGEDINLISFDEEIEKAIKGGNYRLAIRLLYLQSLKRLADANLIDWKVNKTNREYVSEVKNQTWQLQFVQLTNRFESIWYGEVNISKNMFDTLHSRFQQFNNQL